MLLLLPVLALASGQALAQGYAPSHGPCPNGVSLIRQAGTPKAGNQTLSSQEANYVQKRRENVAPGAYASYLDNVKKASNNVTLPAYLSTILSSKNASLLPRLSIATSGGGYRASHFGAGVLAALDGRNSTAVTKGTGGLLQAADILAGLSGGAWLVTSLAQANFPPLYDLALGSSNPEEGGFGGWNAQYDVFQPSANSTVLNTQFTLGRINDLAQKKGAGFDVTFGDYWARALSFHFLNGTTSANFYNNTIGHGSTIKFSDIIKTTSFTSFAQPFPIITSTVQAPGENRSAVLPNEYSPLSNEVYEFNPFETGSWDPSIASFTPTQYLGTSLNAGQPLNSSACVTGFDNAGFLLGASSNLFVEYNVSSTALFNPNITAVAPIIQLINSTFEGKQLGQQLDISAFPNPFYGLGVQGQYLNAGETELNLLDGGLDGQVTPYLPLLVKARQVDVIIGIDGVADTAYNYPNGSSIITTALRTKLANFESSYSFPPVPASPNTFVTRNLTNHPTFFGCNVTDNASPLIIYLANSAPLHPSSSGLTITNTSTGKTQYFANETQIFLDGAFDVATRGFPSDASAGGDALWPVCLACAVVDRARERAGNAREGVCNDCFARYCWDGVEAGTSGGGGGSGGSGGKNRGSRNAGASVMSLGIAVVVGLAMSGALW